jgi:type I restriction enzyme, S subunit
MNAERLLQHFDRVAEAPNAVAHLRRFILDLAVRGKLVNQDPNDEPASELLRRIQAEKARFIKEGKIKNQKPLPVLEESEIPFKVPEEWIWVRLGSIGDWGSGSTPSRGNSEYYDGDITWLKSGELGDCLSLKGSEEKISNIALQKCSFRLNQPGDVLIAMYGATIGKLAILDETAVTNQAVCGCTPFNGILNRYLFLYLLSRREAFHTQSEGGAQPNISKIKIILSPISLPSLAEQQRIVAKVDELMGLCDRLESAQQNRESQRDRLVAASLHHLNQSADGAGEFGDRARFYFNHLSELTVRSEHIKELRQTILNLAVRGKLVPQNHQAPLPSEKLSIVASERESLVSNRELRRIEIVSPLSNEKPFEIPINWSWVFPDQISALINNSLTIGPFGSNLVKSDYKIDGTPLVFVSDIRSEFSLPSKHFVSNTKAEELKSHSVGSGDLLITKMGDPPGDTAIYPTNRPRAIITADCIKWTLHEDLVLTRFLYFAFRAPLVAQQITEITKGAAHQKVSLKRFRSIYIPLPPLAEQHRIVAKIDELMGLCDRLETQLSTTQTNSRQLLESLLHEALAPSI